MEVAAVREVATTLLDLLGLLLVAAGVAAAVFPVVGWAALAVAGGVVLGGSAFAARADDPAGRSAGAGWPRRVGDRLTRARVR